MEVPHIPTGPPAAVHGKGLVGGLCTPGLLVVILQVMRGYDGKSAHTSLSLVHHMLLTDHDLYSRASSLVEEVMSLYLLVMSEQTLPCRYDLTTGTAQTGTRHTQPSCR